MCKVNGCSVHHDKHFCRVCKDTNSSHYSRQCPKGTIIYHGTKREYSDIIVNDGFKASPTGRIGGGVYFTLDFNEAKEIAKYRFQGEQPVVIKCIAEVDYREFNKSDNEQEMLRKLDEWYSFCKNKAKQAIHPPWANNQEFREVCVKDPKSISVIKVYDV